MLDAQGIVLNRRNHREPRHMAHGRLGAHSSSMSMKMTMRQTRRFSMVSSNWDDSFRSQHLPSAIYALAETARGETAVCSHLRRSTFTARQCSPGSRDSGSSATRLIALTRAPLEPYGRAVCCGHRKFMLTNHNVYNYVRAKYFV